MGQLVDILEFVFGVKKGLTQDELRYNKTDWEY